MATVQQLPATVDITLIRGDEYSWPLRFNVDLTGYTFTTGVYNSSLVPAANALPTNVIVPSLDVTIDTELPRTTVLCSVTENQTKALLANGSYRWFLTWVSPGGVTRTVVSGQFRVQQP